MISFFQSSCIPFSFWKETVSVLLGEDRTCPCAIISYIDEPYMELDRDLLGDWLVRVGFGRDLHVPFWFGTASQLIRLHATTPWAVHSLLGAHVPLFHLQVTVRLRTSREGLPVLSFIEREHSTRTAQSRAEPLTWNCLVMFRWHSFGEIVWGLL